MSDARRQVLDQIRKKAKRFNELRTNSNRKLSYEQIVFAFFKEVEEIYILAKDEPDFQIMLDMRCNMLQIRMNSIDPGVNLELIWNDTDKWNELRLHGIAITWSDNFLKQNPDETKSTYIDVANMLLTDT